MQKCNSCFFRNSKDQMNVDTFEHKRGVEIIFKQIFYFARVLTVQTLSLPLFCTTCSVYYHRQNLQSNDSPKKKKKGGVEFEKSKKALRHY